MTRLHLIFLLIVVIRTSSSDAANPFKKLLNGGMTKPLDESGGSTCDSALAKSLVVANEQIAQVELERNEARSNHEMALDTIARLSSELESTKDSLTARILELEQSLLDVQEKSAAEREAFQEEIRATVEAVQKKEYGMQAVFDHQLQESVTWWTTETAKLKDDHAKQIAVLKAESQGSQEQVEIQMKEKIATLEKSIFLLQERHKHQVEAVRKEAAEAIQGMEQELNKSSGDVTAELERTKKQAEEDKLEILRKSEKKIQRLMQEHNNHVGTLKDQHEELVQKLNLDLQVAEKLALEKLKAREQELQAQMEQLELELKEELEEAQRIHVQEQTKHAKSMQKMEKDVSGLISKVKKLERKYDSAQSEIEAWHNLYKTRSYCNFTHVAEDTSAAFLTAGSIAATHLAAGAAVASKYILVVSNSVSEQALYAANMASEQLSEATKIVSKHVTVASREIENTSAPHVEKVRELYRLHLKEHIDKHLLPFHRAHVKPTILRIKKLLTALRKDSKTLSKTLYRRAIANFVDSCPGIKKQLRQMKVHKSIQTFVRDKCKDPKGTIDRSLITLAILFVIFFRGFLWRTLWFLIFLPFRILWFVSPLRLLVSSTPQKLMTSNLPTESNPADADPSLNNDDYEKPSNDAVLVEGFKEERVGPAQ